MRKILIGVLLLLTLNVSSGQVSSSLDADGDGSIKPLSDGLLILRYTLNFTGNTLILNAVESTCTRCTSASIESYINTKSSDLTFDIDGDGSVQPLTDSLLLLRYLFGFRGAELIESAIDNNATRTTATVIEDYIETLVNATDANPTGTLNDTGITSFTDSTEDGNHGRDVTFNDNSNGHAGFDYTKIDTSGTLLQGNGQASCVKDNVTGLIWEVKTNDSGLHDKDDVYSWYNTLNTAENLTIPGFDRPSNTAIRADVSNSNVNGSDDVCFGYDSSDPDNTAKLCNTQAYVARVNTAGLCGASDWRIPSREELRSLLKMDNMQIKGGVSYIDSDYFPNNQASYKVQCYDYFEQIGGVYTLKASAASDPDYQTYCSNFTIGDDDVTRGRGFGYATANSSVTKENSSWTMYFDDFTVAHGIIKDELRYVRLVRGAKLATNASSRYTAQGNGTVADNITGLIWKRCLEGYLFDSAAASCSVDSSDVSSFTWAEALQRAQTVANDNGVVWRVPNMKELGSITKLDVVHFAIDTDAFPDTPTSGETWTASPHTGTGTFVWTITFNNGGDRANSQTDSLSLRLVHD